MAKVTGKTSIRIDDLINNTVVSGEIDNDGQLILQTRGGSRINAGWVSRELGGAWSPTVTYEPGDIVGYGGVIWKAKDQSLNQPPPLFTTLWLRMTGEDANTWANRDPMFMGDSLAENWDTSIKIGNPTVDYTKISGEYESGVQALKVSASISDTQVVYQKEENIVEGGDMIRSTVRARLLSPAPGATLNSALVQSETDVIPKPLDSNSTTIEANEGGDRTLTTEWKTYSFTFTPEEDKPRAKVYFTLDATASNAVFLVDKMKVERELQIPDLTITVNKFKTSTHMMY